MENAEKSNDIFISYCRADVEFTKKIDDGLKKAGLTVWVNWNDIPPGVGGFSGEVQRGIEGAVAINGVSVICQYSDLGWYGFTISNAGLYSIYGYDPSRLGDERYVTPANGGSPAIKFEQSTSTYSAVCKENELMSLLQRHAGQISDKTLYFTEGNIGFGVVFPAELRLESVSVRIPK